MTAKIYYAEIGYYMSQREKLDRLNELGSIFSDQIEWREIIPNQHGDWIDQRGDEFSTLTPLEQIFKVHSNGSKTNRDVWVWNFSREKLIETVKRSIEFYDSQRKKENREEDPSKIYWSDTLESKRKRGLKIEFDEEKIIEGMYRPFCRERFYFSEFVDRPASMQNYFQNENLLICVPGIGTSKPFMPFITNRIPDLGILSASQCFPRYYYAGEERLDAVESDDLFFYIYGFLHLPTYREKFANDLKKSLPRIKILEGSDFESISRIGRELANLHLNYETQPPLDGIRVLGEDHGDFRVRKIKFDKKDRSRIIFNDFISIENIPLEVYDYRVNGRSPVEWIIERYQIKIDSASGIVNDPNDWCEEIGNPRYILDLLLSVMRVSLETQRLISELPTIKF